MFKKIALVFTLCFAGSISSTGAVAISLRLALANIGPAFIGLSTFLQVQAQQNAGTACGAACRSFVQPASYLGAALTPWALPIARYDGVLSGALDSIDLTNTTHRAGIAAGVAISSGLFLYGTYRCIKRVKQWCETPKKSDSSA